MNPLWHPAVRAEWAKLDYLYATKQLEALTDED
jgi:hypothetical protein